MKQWTERQAWLYLARRFASRGVKAFYGTWDILVFRRKSSGLCAGIFKLANLEKISEATLEVMHEKIATEVMNKLGRSVGYLEPRTPKGHRARAKLCAKFAAQVAP